MLGTVSKQLSNFRPIILALANYLLRRIVGLFNEKDSMDGGKRMASNWEVVLTPFLRRVGIG